MNSDPSVIRVRPGDEALVLAAGHLFDGPPAPEWVTRFLSEPSHHLFLALDDGRAAGFVSGVETTHPDKGTEMFLYELSVDEEHRRRGVATALVEALAEFARERGCYGMWVATEPGNEPALATYRRAGAAAPEESVVLSWTF